MKQLIALSGVDGTTFRDTLRRSLMRAQPRVVGIAAAFVSSEGVRQVIEMLRRCGRPTCRLVAGIDNAITHPQALYLARDQGWQVRLGSSQGGIFHPKLVVAGAGVSRNGAIQQLGCVYVGSSNLTNGGLGVNVECGFFGNEKGCPESAGEAFAALWRVGSPATEGALRNYAARFAELARRRAVSELAGLGVSDSRRIPAEPNQLQAQQPPVHPALGTEFAVAAWAGLQSFTGEYRFQVEFPRLAGGVIHRLIQGQVGADGRVEVYCPEDGVTRPMQYRFYSDNSMFRLNIPNEVPGVAWARQYREGLAIIEEGPAGGAPLRVRILRPGAEAREIIGRSAALGTWGKTPTRTYGWW
jgi:hypothetical protein